MYIARDAKDNNIVTTHLNLFRFNLVFVRSNTYFHF